jgi:ubiquitin-conjugating enzyme E2 S
MVIRCLLIEPFPESALNEEAAKLMLEDYDEYFRRARMFTSIHAKAMGAKVQKHEGEATSSIDEENSSMKKAKSEKKTDKKKSLRRL